MQHSISPMPDNAVKADKELLVQDQSFVFLLCHIKHTGGALSIFTPVALLLQKSFASARLF